MKPGRPGFEYPCLNNRTSFCPSDPEAQRKNGEDTSHDSQYPIGSSCSMPQCLFAPIPLCLPVFFLSVPSVFSATCVLGPFREVRLEWLPYA
jgi:hypothetical protein